MNQAETTSGQAGAVVQGHELAARILAAPDDFSDPLQLLAQTAQAFGAGGAGLAAGPGWQPLWRWVAPGKPPPAGEARWPWKCANVLAELRRTRSARSYVVNEQQSLLAACGQPDASEGWILWVERDDPRPWESSAESA